VIHVEGFGLVLLGKTCRLCLECETLVAHQAELDALIRGVVGLAASPKYVVLGTANQRESLLSQQDFEARVSHLERLRAGQLRPQTG
jgi:hypothetical protein